MTISEIKKYMKLRHITYTMLAEKSGIPKSTITKIFSGHTANPRIDTIKAIMTALELNQSIDSSTMGFTIEQIQFMNKLEQLTVLDKKEVYNYIDFKLAKIKINNKH